jgi:hypothetical protein
VPLQPGSPGRASPRSWRRPRSSRPKYYVEFAGADHFLTTNDLGTAYDAQSKYMIAFYKRLLEDDTRYDELLNAGPDKALSKYEHTK